MAQIVQQLKDEHANMARLLNVFERQLNLYRAGRQPDYDILQGLVDYFLDYPDSCHHPKEDMIVRKMLEQGTDRAKPLRGLEEQHRDSFQQRQQRRQQAQSDEMAAVQFVMRNTALPAPWK